MSRRHTRARIDRTSPEYRRALDDGPRWAPPPPPTPEITVRGRILSVVDVPSGGLRVGLGDGTVLEVPRGLRFDHLTGARITARVRDGVVMSWVSIMRRGAA